MNTFTVDAPVQNRRSLFWTFNLTNVPQSVQESAAALRAPHRGRINSRVAVFLSLFQHFVLEPVPTSLTLQFDKHHIYALRELPD